MKLKGFRLSEEEVSQEFDLKKILGIKSVDDSLAEAFGQAIIDKIVERTEKGRGVDGSKLKAYSKSYSESLEFKAFGKSKSKVNMTLTGDMLSSLTITKINDGKITVGWKDPLNNAKAFGHISGMEGHPFLEGKTPIRNFFGLEEADTKELRGEFLPALDGDQRENDGSLIEKINELISSMDKEGA